MCLKCFFNNVISSYNTKIDAGLRIYEQKTDTYRFSKGLNCGIKNRLNTELEYMSNGSGMNTDSSIYDVIGKTFSCVLDTDSNWVNEIRKATQ